MLEIYDYYSYLIVQIIVQDKHNNNVLENPTHFMWSISQQTT